MRTWLLACVLATLAHGAWPAHAQFGAPMLMGNASSAPPQPPPSNPVMVQHESSSNTRFNGFVGPPFCYYYQLPNAAIAGNAVILGVTFGSNLTPSATDDAGNGYTVGKHFYDSGDNQSIAVLGAFNIAGGVRLITLCFPSDPGQNVQPMATEFANVTGFDGAGVANNGSGTTVSPGTLTPTQTGDLIYQVVASIGCPNFQQCQASYAAQSNPNLPMSLLSADLLDGFSAQYGGYAATASVSPTMGTGTSRGWVSAAIALKSGASGSVPTGLRIVHMIHETLTNETTFFGPSTPYPNPTNMQFPSSGNLLVAQIIGGDGSCCNVNSVTDTANPSWLQTAEIQGSCCSAQTFYVPNAVTANNLAITMNWTSAGGAPHMAIYDVAGAATSPFDKSNGNTGFDNTDIATNNALATGYTIAPAQATELILSIANEDYNVNTGIDGQKFLGNSFDGDLYVNNAPTLVDEQGGLASFITTNTSPVSFTWRFTRALGAAAGSEPNYPGNWASMSAAFKGQ